MPSKQTGRRMICAFFSFLHPYASKKNERSRHIPTSFPCPCSHKKLKGARHVLTPYLAFKCILQEMGGGKYVYIPPLHSHAFKKIERGRHVPTPHL
jgi:hypothetical protein